MIGFVQGIYKRKRIIIMAVKDVKIKSRGGLYIYTVGIVDSVLIGGYRKEGY